MVYVPRKIGALPEDWEDRLATAGRASVQAIEHQLKITKKLCKEKGLDWPLEENIYEMIGGYHVGVFSRLSSMYEVSDFLTDRIDLKWHEILAFKLAGYEIKKKPRSHFSKRTPIHKLSLEFGTQDAENFYRRFEYTNNYEASIAEFSSLAAVLLAAINCRAQRVDQESMQQQLIEIAEDSGAMGREDVDADLCHTAAIRLVPEIIKAKTDDEIALELRQMCVATIGAVDEQVTSLVKSERNEDLRSFRDSENHCSLIVFYTFGIFSEMCKFLDVAISDDDLGVNRQRWYDFLEVVAPNFTMFPLSTILPDGTDAPFFDFCARIGSREIEVFWDRADGNEEKDIEGSFEPEGLKEIISAMNLRDGGPEQLAQSFEELARRAGIWETGRMNAELCQRAAAAVHEKKKASVSLKGSMRKLYSPRIGS